MRLEAHKTKRVDKSQHPIPSKLACAVSAAILMLGVAAHKAEAATLRVDNNGDAGVGCTLREAVVSINGQSSTGGCTNVSGDPFGTADTITFASTLNNQTISLNDGLDFIRSAALFGQNLDAITVTGSVSSTYALIENQTPNVQLSINGVDFLAPTQANRGIIVLVDADLELRNSVVSGRTTESVSLITAYRNSLSLSVSSIQNGGDAAIYSRAANVTMSYVNVQNNQGGGIKATNTMLDLEDVSILDNTGKIGGGIKLTLGSSLSLRGSEILRNTATLCGGGISLDASSATVQGSGFSYNAALDTEYGYGGSIRVWNGNVDISDGSVMESNATRSGGAISFNESTCYAPTLSPFGASSLGSRLIGSLDLMNGALSSDSVTVSASSPPLPDLIMTNMNVRDNTARTGGALGLGAGEVSITDSRFSSNQASAQGGAIHAERFLAMQELTVSNSSLVLNTAETGGGIHLEPTSRLNLNSSILSNNSSSQRGGGLSMETFSSASIRNSTVSYNSALQRGGGVFNSAGTLNVLNSTLENNNAEYGGGIASQSNDPYSASINLANSQLNYNSAVTSGGIYSASSVINIDTSTITGNSATNAGSGAIALVGGEMLIERSLLYKNSANNYGGGISVLASANLTMNNTTLSANTANTQGGGVYAASADTVSLNNVTMRSNKASIAGRSLMVASSNVFVQNSILSGTRSLINDECYFSSGPTESIDIDHASIIEDGSCGTGEIGLAGLDPVLRDNGGPTLTHALTKDSAAYNLGNNITCLRRDQRGEDRDRSVSNPCDIGAYEFGAGSRLFVIPLKNGKSIVVPL